MLKLCVCFHHAGEQAAAAQAEDPHMVTLSRMSMLSPRLPTVRFAFAHASCIARFRLSSFFMCLCLQPSTTCTPTFAHRHAHTRTRIPTLVYTHTHTRSFCHTHSHTFTIICSTEHTHDWFTSSTYQFVCRVVLCRLLINFIDILGYLCYCSISCLCCMLIHLSIKIHILLWIVIISEVQ